MTRLAVALLCLALLAAPLAGEAQLPGKVPRVGHLLPTTAAEFVPHLPSFRQALREAGYVEGESILLELRWAGGRADRFAELAAELVRLKVDVIVAWSTPAALAAKRATSAIPIVMATAGDPVGVGLVASLARPGGNVTGNAILLPELGAKRMDLLKEALPRVSRVGVLSNPANQAHA